MLDLISLIQVRFTSIISGVLFDKPDGTSGSMAILPLGVQSKDDDEAPYLVLRVSAGSDGYNGSTVTASLICCIYVNPDRDNDGEVTAADNIIDPAIAAMQTVVDSYRELSRDGNYFPYSLESISWRVGDKDGLHPGPDYYEVSADLVFSQDSIFS